jgi:hypothetical protein
LSYAKAWFRAVLRAITFVLALAAGSVSAFKAIITVIVKRPAIALAIKSPLIEYLS